MIKTDVEHLVEFESLAQRLAGNIFRAGVRNLYFLCSVGAIKILETQSLSVESAP